ncbi:putative transcription factor interactor and regulator CCHC(Zn) family [Helianthus debilis subsp. tardiflorus]
MKSSYGCDESSSGYEHDVHDKLPLPTSGIRATPDLTEDVTHASASVLPCKHCSDEQRERSKGKVMQKRCYYCKQTGHQIAFCKEKENDEAALLIRQVMDVGTQIQDADNTRDSEFIISGTDGGRWSEISYVSTKLKRHFSGNLESFKRIKNIYGVETNTGENQFFFIRGLGVLDVISGSENFRIQRVYYTPDLDRNVLSLDQLIIQGITVKFNGERCKLFPMFCTPLQNKKNYFNGTTREDEMGEKEKLCIIEKQLEHETFKSDYLNEYFERLNLSSNEPDWNIMILQSMKFNQFQDCKALLDMLEDGEYVAKYKYYIEGKFEEMIDWFLRIQMGIRSRPIPVFIRNNKRVNLFDLYMVVKREGGHRTVTFNSLWAMISKDMGHEYEDGEYMRIAYAMYLDVLIYYYKFKSIQENVRGTSSHGAARNEDAAAAAEGGRRAISEGCMPEDEREHYALFAGNDWKGMNKMQKRRRFDFRQAEKAVNEANRSVSMNSRGYNPV